MPTISSATLEQVIRARGSNAQPDSDGDYVLRFKADENHGCGDLVIVGIEGDDKDIFCVRMTIDRSFPIDEWKRVLMLVNDFNREYRWPKAYVSFPQSEDDKTVDVHCASHILCAEPVTQDQLSLWLSATIFGGDQLYTTLIVENKIPLR